ncbi:SAM-dependent methyltransferase [Pararhizobium capsulatum DSM 1112]|uniref:SAM-dependent methyltransferase n=1 Tax=Pararhizobium capsulatum DSM 1112 TaxID=1121113 RepID=A0ABU0BLR3_9HYPH|nr:SAM-dependent methyltransferase [Pararhizobium capsulatum DSM 1112]
MKQNIYDDPTFFANYSAMPRSTGGLEAAGEWPVLRDMLPDLTGKRVLDLSCGFGWHCRYARSAGASHVVGVDLSESMLARARAMTDDAGIERIAEPGVTPEAIRDRPDLAHENRRPIFLLMSASAN